VGVPHPTPPLLLKECRKLGLVEQPRGEGNFRTLAGRPRLRTRCDRSFHGQLIRCASHQGLVFCESRAEKDRIEFFPPGTQICGPYSNSDGEWFPARINPVYFLYHVPDQRSFGRWACARIGLVVSKVRPWASKRKLCGESLKHLLAFSHPLNYCAFFSAYL